MKLYIYRLWGGKFSCGEVDVEEKPKTYIVTRGFEFGYEGQRIRKGRNTVILTEKDKKKAVEMLIRGQEGVVESHRERLEREVKALEVIKAELEKE